MNARSTRRKPTSCGSILITLTDIPSVRVTDLAYTLPVRFITLTDVPPGRVTLTDIPSVRGASGKPPTWFPLGRHVQKDLLSPSLFMFAASPVDQISLFL
jgi:hypothetical protein